MCYTTGRGIRQQTHQQCYTGPVCSVLLLLKQSIHGFTAQGLGAERRLASRASCSCVVANSTCPRNRSNTCGGCTTPNPEICLQTNESGALKPAATKTGSPTMPTNMNSANKKQHESSVKLLHQLGSQHSLLMQFRSALAFALDTSLPTQVLHGRTQRQTKLGPINLLHTKTLQ